MTGAPGPTIRAAMGPARNATNAMGPVVAVAQADALALVQNRRRSLQVGLGQVLDLDADHVLAAEGGGDRLGEAPR